MNECFEELKESLIEEQEKCNNNYNPSNIFVYSTLCSVLAKIKEIQTNKYIKSLIENGY